MTDIKDEGGRSAEEARKDLIADGTTPSSATASGLAALGSPGAKSTAKEPENAEGVVADAVKPGAPPFGDQTTAAFFTRSGSIPGNSIPSPSGPVPASTIADEATRDAAVKAARDGARSSHLAQRNGRLRISDEAAGRMSPAELRAVAYDRGYNGVEGGRASVLRKFLDAQKGDQSLQDPPEGHHLGISAPAPVPIPVAGVATTGNPLATPSTPGGLETPAGTLRNADGSTASATPPAEPKAEKAPLTHKHP